MHELPVEINFMLMFRDEFYSSLFESDFILRQMGFLVQNSEVDQNWTGFFSGCGEHGYQNTVICFHLHGLVIAMCQISMLLIMWSAAELWSLVRWWPELRSACYNLQVVVYSPAWQINRRITSQKLYLARWTQIRLLSAPYPAAVTPIMLLFFFEKLTPMLLQSPFPTPKDLHHSIDWHHHR